MALTPRLVVRLPAPAFRSEGNIGVNINARWLDPVRFVATTGSLASLVNGASYAGLTLATGDTFLYQPTSGGVSTPGMTVGIYVVGVGAPTRRTDADTGAELLNASVFVLAGNPGAGTSWINVNSSAPLVGTDNIIFRQFDSSPDTTDIYETRVQVAAATVPTTRTTLRTLAYATAGDGGGATYKKVSSPPTHNGKFQSADGAWWEIAEDAISVLALGADPTGVADCYAAIQSAIGVARTQGKRRIIFPAGTYLITQAGAFNTGGTTDGLTIQGAGMQSTLIKFINAVTTTPAASNYLYTDNNTDKWINFQGMTFEGDSTNKNSRFARITSTAQAQSIRFWDVRWRFFEGITSCEGTATASEMLYMGCKGSTIYGKAFRIDNAQSMNHNHYACDYESLEDDLVYVTKGGIVSFYGGSIILNAVGFSTTGAVLRLNETVGSGIGSTNWTYNFNGVRTELYGDSKFLDGQAQGSVHLVGCNTANIQGTDNTRIIYTLYHGLMLSVTGGTFNGQVYLQAITGSTYASAMRPATFIIRDAVLRPQFKIARDILPNQKGGQGKAIIEHCKSSSQTSQVHEPLNQCLGWDDGPNNFAAPKRIVAIRSPVNGGGLPIQTTDIVCKLPLGAVVTGVRLYHLGGAGPTAQTYTLKNDDGTKTLKTWTFDITATQIAQDATLYHLCDTDTNRSLRFAGVAGNSAASYAGYCEVEYIA